MRCIALLCFEVHWCAVQNAAMKFWQARLVDSLLIHCAAQQYRSTTLHYCSLWCAPNNTPHCIEFHQLLCLTFLCYNISKPPHDPTLWYFKAMDRAARLRTLHFMQRSHTIESRHVFEKRHVCISSFWCLRMRMSHVLTLRHRVSDKNVPKKNWPRLCACKLMKVYIDV